MSVDARCSTVTLSFLGAVLMLGGCVRTLSVKDQSPGDASQDVATRDVVMRDVASDGATRDGAVGEDETRSDATADGSRGDGAVTTGYSVIPAGTFWMGSPVSEACRPAQTSLGEDRHEVTLTHAFEMAQKEVTWAEFQTRMGYAPVAPLFVCKGGCPVERVNWHEAAAFCNALSKAASFAPCYSCKGSGPDVTCWAAFSVGTERAIYACRGFRLPTEAEWERARRAGAGTAFDTGDPNPALCTSDTVVDPPLDAIAWYCANAKGVQHAVGTKLPNAWGLYDMAGNVVEWCHDGAAVYAGAVTNPVGPGGEADRVTRGGSYWWCSDAARAAARETWPSTKRSVAAGFRCVRSL